MKCIVALLRNVSLLCLVILIALTTTVNAATKHLPSADEPLTDDEIRVILDQYQIEYRIHENPVNSFSITRAELIALIEQGRLPVREDSADAIAKDTLTDIFSDASGAARWLRHSCYPHEVYIHVELLGQTWTYAVDEGVYFSDHRREFAKTRNITPRTYYITEGPTGRLSEPQRGLSDGSIGYSRYTIGVTFNVPNCIGSFCWSIDEDVEASCVFDSD